MAESRDYPTEVFSHAKTQLKWWIPMIVSGERVHRKIQSGSGSTGQVDIRAGDLILTDRQSETTIIHRGAEVIVMEVFAARLTSDEFIL